MLRFTFNSYRIACQSCNRCIVSFNSVWLSQVKTDFNALESEVNKAEQRAKTEEVKAFEETGAISGNLAYKSKNVQKQEEKLRHSDPNKAAQLERLGMGFGYAKEPSHLSHSASAGLSTVEQVSPKSSSRLKSVLDKYGDQTDGYFDRWGSCLNGMGDS